MPTKRRLKMNTKLGVVKLAVPLFFAIAYGPAQGLATPILGSSLDTFAVLGQQGVTDVPTSTIGGNLGSAPNASVGGGYVFTAGSLQANTALAQNAQINLTAAIGAVNSSGPGTLITGGNLDAFEMSHGGSIAPGTYMVPAATANLTGTLILNGGGSNTAVWNFLFPSSLITSTTSKVIVQNVGNGAGVGLYWDVGTQATLNGPTFEGNVLAGTLIAVGAGVTIDCGRLASSTAQVTLIMDTISTGCASTGFTTSGGFDQGGGGTTGGGGGGGGTAVPEPGTLGLMALSGLMMLGARLRRKTIA
jgi:Ice-binding-like/PEP-CTERM motif